MTRNTFSFLLLSALVASPALAQSYKRLVNQAAESLEDAESAARRARGQCRATAATAIDAATNHVYDLRKEHRARNVETVKNELSAVATNASYSGCPVPVLENLQRAIGLLEEVRIALYNERRDRPGRHDDDDDDDQSPPMPGHFAQLSPLTVQPNAQFENEPAVKVSLPELRLNGLKGHAFYLAARYRSYEGQWNDWVTTQQWTVPTDAFVWRNAFNHFFRASTLAEDDFSNGRFVARVAVFDGSTGQELASREITFQTRLPQLPPPPNLPPPVVVVHDCGTGNDIGCGMTRNGVAPMDAATYQGVMQSLRSNQNEMLRAQLARSVFERNGATAIQFGLMLDLFPNEMMRLSVAQTAASRIVNPQHALGYASKWQNPMLQSQYTQIMLGQSQGMPTQPVPPMPPPGRPPYGQPGRDCGTGNDPGCAMLRNGRAAMDGATFQGIIASLRNTPNELTRADLCNTVFEGNMLTALQLSAIMDLFGNELTLLDVSKSAAPHVVNPQQAIGLSTHFRNSLLGRDFVEVMARQR
jgi:hypothetical protein